MLHAVSHWAPSYDFNNGRDMQMKGKLRVGCAQRKTFFNQGNCARPQSAVDSGSLSSKRYCRHIHAPIRVDPSLLRGR